MQVNIYVSVLFSNQFNISKHTVQHGGGWGARWENRDDISIFWCWGLNV